MRTSTVTLVALAAAAVLAAGCRARLTSTVTINGAAFVPTSCRSGEALGFSGVELTNASGQRLRIASTASGQGLVYLFPPNASVMMLGLCGPFSIERQSSRINNVYNVRGNATLSCVGLAGAVTGSVTFENCH
jgi:hypothetical protein